MRIAAAHLRSGDVLFAPPSSDEHDFDRYESVADIPDAVRVVGNEPRFGDVHADRRYIPLTRDHGYSVARVWNDTRLIEVDSRQ